MSALTIESLPNEVLERVTAKALAEGLSTQEYVRRLLARDAQLRSASEMLSLQQSRQASASTLDDFDSAVKREQRRRRSGRP